MKIKVILTSAGSQVAPGIISMIKGSSGYEVFLIGVDAGLKENLVGRYFCDVFYNVPYAKERDYIKSMLDIAKKEKAAVIFPASDEEALALSRNRDLFDSVGTKIACADAASIKKSMDKCALMKLLMENDIPAASFYELQKLSDIERYSKKLGYPKRDVVIKPRVSRGSKGFRIITKDSKLFNKFSANEFYFTSLNEILRMFEKHPRQLKKFFMMEYLAGNKYSVDMLIEHSRPVVSVCRRKIFPIGSPTQLADITYDKDIIEYAKKVASFLDFDYFVQVEIGRNKESEPCLIEINPRIDATLPIVEGVGINYFKEMIHYALSGSYPKRYYKFKEKPLRFQRYWQHIFSKI